MNRSDLVVFLKERTGLSTQEAEWFVRQFFETLAQGLKRDGRVELRGFGVFKLSNRRQAGFQNPKDGRYYGGMDLKTIKFYPSTAIEEE
ncbi:HU family DNA-binding protein [Sulfidibacter corallicola]|uniref:HU family DNA-binding protein n=1 Tax=Sulfidibacter corallicola TaxID=2818388 RepID=A0A8A4TDK9_SULCO|nr:HU family DNA-binding protein [Sulfidibacter corallicola]QTD47743.1 HU family DNA-binding protein [Sulfidibacter corallicola]